MSGWPRAGQRLGFWGQVGAHLRQRRPRPGRPANSRPVEPGDVVRVEVEGLGALENEIVQGPAPIRDDVGAQPASSEEVMSTALGGDWEFRGIRAPRKS